MKLGPLTYKEVCLATDVFSEIISAGRIEDNSNSWNG